MKIGIFGGSFDPIHNGHVAIAKQAITELELDELLVIPAASNPFKEGADGASAAYRFDSKMRVMLVRAAFNGVEKAVVDEREIARGGTSYAIDTVRSIAEENLGAELFFIIGEDSQPGLPKWKDYDELKNLCTFKTYKRTRESSTEIRRRLAAGDDISSLVPEAVALFIKYGVHESPDERIVAAVRAGLVRKGGFCPCRLPKLPEFFCPCDEFRAQLADKDFHGLCHCRLYVKD